MNRTMERREYHRVPSTPGPSTTELNALGEQGWELVLQTGPMGHYVFKRRAAGFRERITLDQRARVQNARAQAE